MIARSKSWQRSAILPLLALFLQISWATPAAAQDAGEGGSFSLGTASTGGTYHPVGVALSTLVKLRLLPEFDVDLTAVNTGGSQDNVELMRRDDVQFAIISALAGYDARTGTGQFAGAEPAEDLRAITTLWLSTDHLIVRNDAVQSGTVDDFLDLRGRPVSLGRQDSGTLLGNRRLLSALGADADSDFQLIELGYAESADALAAGAIDGMSLSGGLPIEAVQDAFDTLGDQVTVLEFDDDQLARVDRGRGLWQRAAIPSGTYPGQNRDIATIGSPNILAVRADVDEEVVYQITKTIFEELEYLHGLHGATRQISLDNAVTNLPLEIHAGAARYFEEKGVDLPPPPVQLDDDLLVRYDTVDQARADINQGAVRLFAGTEGDTSSRVAAEFAALLTDAATAASSAEGENTAGAIRLLPTNGGGIGHNLTDLLYLSGVDAALVRADLLNYAAEQDAYPSMANQVTYISEMFPEEIHLLVRDDITSADDLRGQKVNLGPPGIGSDITASIVFTELGIGVEGTRYAPHMAIEKLKQGEIAGAVFVGGKPMPLLQQIERGSGLKLMPLPAIDYFDSYRTAQISSLDYPNLLPADAAMQTVAVRSALLTYAWRPGSSRYEALSGLTDALFDNLLTLHEDGYHPKWREVDPTQEFAAWTRFGPATRWIQNNEGTARRIAGAGRLLVEEATQRVVPLETNSALPNDNDLDAALTPSPAPPADVPTAPAPAPAPALGAPSQGDESSVIDQVSPELPAEAANGEGVVPTAPVIELAPASPIEPVPNNEAPAGAASGISVEEDRLPSPRPILPSTPATGVNAPTF